MKSRVAAALAAALSIAVCGLAPQAAGTAQAGRPAGEPARTSVAAWRYHKPAGDKRCESHGVALDGKKYVFHGVHTSDELTGGWIQVWFNGVPQTFTGGSSRYPCRTWDVSNDPKWGVYGATDTDFTNTVAGQKVGDGYNDVAN